MNFVGNSRVTAVTTGKKPGPFTTERGPNGYKARSERAKVVGPQYRNSPYDNPNIGDVAGVGTGPGGKQSGYRPSKTTIMTTQPTNGPLWAQSGSQLDGRPRQPFGGTPQAYVTGLQNAILSQQGLPTRQFGGTRAGNVDMTSEVAGDQGFSTYSGFAQPRLFPKTDAAPDGQTWNLLQTPRPTGLNISMPTPNPGGDGTGGEGFFATMRQANANFGQADPFSLASMRQSTTNPIQDGIDQNTNQPMVMALLAMKSEKTGMLGVQVAFEEEQEGQLMYEAIEDNGTIRQAISKYEGNVEGNLLPHTTFNVPSVNWFLAQEDKAAPLRGWTANEVLSMIYFHGAIRGDASARFGPGEPYGLSRRIINCNLGGGIEFIRNEWGSVESGRRLYHIFKRVSHDKIRANPTERPGSFSLTGSQENVIVVKETKTKNPWQVVPWVGDNIVKKPTKEDTEFINDDGIVEKGFAFFIGTVFQVDFASPWQSQLDHCGTNCAIRAQLPMIGVKINGRLHMT